MSMSVNEIIASHTNSIQRLDEQRSRYMRKLQDLENDIKKGMGQGSIFLLDWARDVKFYLDSDTDAKVNYESMIKEYTNYVNELVNYIGESQQSDAATVELQRLVNELGKKVRSLTGELAKQDDELARAKGQTLAPRKSLPKPFPAPSRHEEPEPEEEEPAEEEVAPEAQEEAPEELTDHNDGYDEQNEEPEQPTAEEPSREVETVTEEVPELINEQKDGSMGVYVTDSQLEHLKRVNTPQAQLAMNQASKIRKSHEMFTDYGTTEHRYYKTVMPLFKIKEYMFDVTADNMCRVCKKPIGKHKVACSDNCKKTVRKFKTWFAKYGGELKKLDTDLKPIASRKGVVEHLKRLRRKEAAKRPSLDDFEMASQTREKNVT
jgi:hypothetical protein